MHSFFIICASKITIFFGPNYFSGLYQRVVKLQRVAKSIVTKSRVDCMFFSFLSCANQFSIAWYAYPWNMNTLRALLLLPPLLKQGYLYLNHHVYLRIKYNSTEAKINRNKSARKWSIKLSIDFSKFSKMQENFIRFVFCLSWRMTNVVT